jgi:hypothetical protein
MLFQEEERGTMKSSSVARLAAGLTVIASLPGTAFAQAYIPASEIVGLPVRVTTNGVTNTVILNAGGQAIIKSPAGRAVNATWTGANSQLCLNNGTAEECWPHGAPFQAGQPQTLTSSCNSTSTWLAASTNEVATPSAQRGERGR